MINDQTTAFWNDFIATLPPEHPARKLPVPQAERFGDNPKLADELGHLIHQGIKTATCASLWEHESEGSAIPQTGQYEIVLDGQDQPLAIYLLIEVTIRPFDEVDASFAFEEGEADRSLESWREGHWRFFSRILRPLGLEADPKMPLVCQRFQVVHKR
jgi:uncharacterized protein YhfF